MLMKHGHSIQDLDSLVSCCILPLDFYGQLTASVLTASVLTASINDRRSD